MRKPSFSVPRFQALLCDEMEALKQRDLVNSYTLQRRPGVTIVRVYQWGEVGSAREMHYAISDFEVESLNLSLSEIAAFVSLKLVEKVESGPSADGEGE